MAPVGSVFKVEFRLPSCWNGSPRQSHHPEPRAFHPVANAIGLEVSAATEQAGPGSLSTVQKAGQEPVMLLKKSHWHAGLKKLSTEEKNKPDSPQSLCTSSYP